MNVVDALVIHTNTGTSAKVTTEDGEVFWVNNLEVNGLVIRGDEIRIEIDEGSLKKRLATGDHHTMVARGEVLDTPMVGWLNPDRSTLGLKPSISERVEFPFAS